MERRASLPKEHSLRWVALAAACLLAGALFVALFLVPVWIHPNAPIPSAIRDPVKRIQLENDHRHLQNETRGTAVQALGGLVVLLGGGTGAWLTWKQMQLTRDGHITERFGSAIDHLGHDKLDVRLGGIYALERIARDSRADHGPVMEVLTAFVREHATIPEEASPAEKPPATDLQAALTVLSRRRTEHDQEGIVLDLVGANLQAANLAGGHLGGVLLDGANLRRAYFWQANLQFARFDSAELEGAAFGGANLAGASLLRANCKSTNFLYAKLTKAVLTEANLENANLQSADLRGAYVHDTNLEGAELYDAKLQGVSLVEARGLTKSQILRAEIDVHTKMPSYLLEDQSTK